MDKNSNVRNTTGNPRLDIRTTDITPSPEKTTDGRAPQHEEVPSELEQKSLVTIPPRLPRVVVLPPRKRGIVSKVSVYFNKDRHRGSLFIVLTAIMLFFVVIGGSYVVLGANIGSPAAQFTNPQPSKATAIVTITPLHTLVKNTYTIAIVTGQPNIAQKQVKGARTISGSRSQSLLVNATGKDTTPARSATGTLTFFRPTKAVTIPAGTPFLDKNKIALVLNAPVTLKGKGLAVKVGAHANPAGSKGNVRALDINGNFCYPNCITGSVFLVQNTAFAGGKDPQSYTFVQQGDINNGASQLENSLTSTAQGTVLTQIMASEQLVGSISCGLSSVSANQKAGARVPNVTVSVTKTCSGEVYSAQPVQVLAVNLLKSDVTRLVGPGYALVGNVSTQVLTQPKLIDTQGTLSVKIMATGTALYQFPTTETPAFAKLIAGKSLADAQALLLTQTGVAHVTINISDNPADKLPNDPGKIAFVVSK